MQEFDQKDRLVLFKESIKSEATRRAYMFYLKRYMAIIGQDDSSQDARAIESKIIDYIISMKQQNKSHFAIKNHISSILAFYKINDVVLNVSKIKRFIPSKKKSNRDRAYTHQEIHSMLDIA